MWDEGVLLVGWEGVLAPAVADDAVAGYGPMSRLMREVEVFARGELRGLPVEGLVRGLGRRLMGVSAMPALAGVQGLTAAQTAGYARMTRWVLEDWRSGVRVFARRLWADVEELGAWMGVTGEIEELRVAGSDVHGPNGAAVEVQFAGGLAVFYKPRAVTGERFWAELQGCLGEIDEGAAVRVAAVLERRDEAGKYGWMEGLASEAREPGEWVRAGALVCSAMLAGMSDLHMANVVATSGGPAVVDAECLGGCLGLQRDLKGEVMGTGLLPAGERPEVSGLFGAGAALTGVKVPRWREDGGVEMVGAGLLEQKNRMRGAEARLLCLPEMVEGFGRAAEAIEGIRGELLAEGGWLERLEREHAPRVVRRGTLEYGLAMSRGLRVEAMGSEAGRRRALGENWSEAEVAALLRLWVPRFAEGERPRCEGRTVRERLGSWSAGELRSEAGGVLAGALFCSQRRSM